MANEIESAIEASLERAFDAALAAPRGATLPRAGAAAKMAPSPAWLRAAFRATSALAPAVAARLARALYFRPRRARVRDDERAALARGERIVAATPRGDVIVHAWGEGPPVLLVHGWGGHAGQMTPFVGPLVRAGFRAVAPDMPGHGESPGTLSSLVHFADAIGQIAALTGPLRGVVAHSLGGASVALALARGLEAERAVFFAPPARFDSFVARFGAGVGAPDAVLQMMLAAAERDLGVDFDAVRPEALAPSLRVPLLIVHDEADAEIAAAEGRDLARAWPGAELVPTSGLGHLRLLRDEACVARALDFIADDARASPRAAFERRPPAAPLPSAA
jgi:pimeloyl-ACP methyl ester carboxylesterase